MGMGRELATDRVEPCNDAVLDLGAPVVDAGIDDRDPYAFAGGKTMRIVKMQRLHGVLKRLVRGGRLPRAAHRRGSRRRRGIFGSAASSCNAKI